MKKNPLSKHAMTSRLLACCLLLDCGLSWSASIERVSTTSTNQEVNEGSRRPSITPNGRFVLFNSFASDLVTGDTNGVTDIFLKDRKTGVVTRISTNALGQEGNAESGNYFNAAITPNARFAVFESEADNLVQQDLNIVKDVFLKNIKTAAVTRVSTNSQGVEANGESFTASISANGRYVAFTSAATNLVDGDSNANADIFVKDLKTGAVTRASTNSQGQQANNGNSYSAVISPNGRYVVFESDATNLVDNDTNASFDIFLKDLKTGKITRVSTSSENEQANFASSNANLTANGRYVVFDSEATNLVAGDNNDNGDVFVKDLKTGAIKLASTNIQGQQADSVSRDASISSNGRYVVFQSSASNLGANVLNDSIDEIFLKDMKTGQVTLVSANNNGVQADNSCWYPTLTPNGKYIAFYSYAANLVDGDSNNSADVFVFNPKGKP